jgi:superfamily II DNA helicase RecQ/very-short-patch-repair endonuclease
MERYIEQIQSIANPSFQQIRKVAWSSVSHFTKEERDGFWKKLNGGTNLLDSHELMCQYLWSYGKMHEAKIYEALKSISDLYNLLNDDFAIIDWGCGQGLATVCFFDFLNQQNIENKAKEIILIEPSELALERAKLHVNTYIKNENKIKTICKYLDDIDKSDLETDQPITIHFFSNILDIPKIDLKKLAQNVGENVIGEHYFFCVGPLNYGNLRIDAFYNYFKNPSILFNIERSENKLQMIAEDVRQKSLLQNYTLKLKVFKFERNKIYYIPVKYYPAVQFHAGYQLDCVKSSFKTLPSEQQNKIAALCSNVSNFEVSAPFDIGASIYDDVHPVFAVLNNIITRGLPTKASPFIEQIFNAFGNTKQDDNLGAIVFNKNKSDANDLFLSLHLIDSRLKLTTENCSEKLESDLERTYVIEKAPVYLRQLLQPQRALFSITKYNRHHSQRVDFACEFPYSNDNIKGCIIELDGQQYHTNSAIDRQRDYDIKNRGWNCIRISDDKINETNHHAIDNEYIRNVEKAYTRNFDEKWTESLQMVLSPIAIARVQKTILEALMTGILNIEKDEWKILVLERDVPCAAIALEDLKQMFNHLIALSCDYSTMNFPEIKLEIISTQEFANSPLHLDSKPTVEATTKQKNTKYDIVIDISMLRRSDIENISFSEYQCHNRCYFNIRSSHYRRTDRHIYTSDTIEYKPLVNKDRQGNYKNVEETTEHLKFFLQLLFRKEDFRPGQLPILSRALQNKSVIGLLPTGGGKSLTYQLAAMLQPGVTIIIDPLRSLMKDQYDGLINNGIDTCTFINSTLDAEEKNKRENQMESSQMQFVFLSPERLCIYKFRERLKAMRDSHVYFAYGVIDEVHCVSEWGHDFRFSYLHLGRNLYNYICPKDQEKHLTLFGLTATASFDVLADVERELSGNEAFPLDADAIVRYENTDRLELQYKIERVPVEYAIDMHYDKNNHIDPSLPKAVNISDKWAVFQSKQVFLKEYVQRIPDLINELQTDESIIQIEASYTERQNTTEDVKDIDLKTTVSSDMYIQQDEYNQAGIVFCPHRDKTGIAVFPNAQSLNEVISQIGTFVGSNNDDEDNANTDQQSFRNLELFRNNKLSVMVATKAFGMGIDKPNVRFTVNMNHSSSLESFVQEAGRAGRDRKIALATILFADYKLVRINSKYQNHTYPLSIIKCKWFKEEDLDTILQHYNLSIDKQYLDYFTPQHDMVKLHCEVCNTRFGFKQCGNSCDRMAKCRIGGKGTECEVKCQFYDTCLLQKTPKEARGFQYIKGLEEILKPNDLDIPKKNLEYVSVDYETVMFFYNNNFKGSLMEKQVMHQLLSISPTEIFYDDNAEIKQSTETVPNFLEKLLSSNTGKVIVAFINYGNKYVDIAKAIYRMCCIELIDDFTQDYTNNRFRIVTKRKANGEYYQGLKRFLMRYYSEEKAEQEIREVPNYKGENEIHKCLGYLTEFIYEKIAVKRKRAIDDMRTFCIQGLDDTKDWKEVNEDLKDFIYYYFNSKYARDDFETDNGEPFSLTSDTVRGKKSSFDILLKYLRVIDEDVYGSSGSPKDSVKHLQGAVRLIRRSLTDSNASLSMLNMFCLAYLGTNNNEMLEEELESSYKEGYKSFYEDYTDKDLFYNGIEKLMAQSEKISISKKTITAMKKWKLDCELDMHNKWLNNFKESYIQ